MRLNQPTHNTSNAEQRGASLVEYVVLVALIALACYVAVSCQDKPVREDGMTVNITSPEEMS